MQKMGPSRFVAVSWRRQDVIRRDFLERLLVDVAMLSQPPKAGFRKRLLLVTLDPLEISCERLVEKPRCVLTARS